ncbi:MAG: type II/IV secretion system protein [Myxococcales bacterium]|nr:type II/IV secretion system protein [Myxococcales bacterium]
MSSSAENWLLQRPRVDQAKVIDRKLLNQLVKDDCIDEVTAMAILDDADYDSQTPGWRLVLSDLIEEPLWAELVGSLFGLASAELSDFTIDRDLFSIVPEELAERYQLIPLTRAGDEVYIGITDPREIAVYDHLRSLFTGPIRLLVVPPTQIAEAIRVYYMAADTSELEHVEASEVATLTEGDLQALREGGEAGKIVELVDRLFAHAIGVGASDIHIEPYGSQVRVRFRIDGILRVGPNYPIVLCPWIVSRVKVLAKLDIAERYSPQDGRVRTKMSGVPVDMRVSCLPVAGGEKVVIRLLGHKMLGKSLSGLGMGEELLESFRAEIMRSQGMILVTGPTGSGKSTTLYAALMERVNDEVNVVTVEDPIEYEIPDLNQVPINKKRGVTFPKALRAILRQDPDIILVGEIRDHETGCIAAEAAVTGHLVLSTLHTNDAAAAVHRLIEMGVPCPLIAPSLQAILAQRLLRAVCKDCSMRYTASPTELEALVPHGGLRGIKLVAGRGCAACEGSGYKGRIPVHELLLVDDEMRGLIGEGATTLQIRQHAIAHGMKDLRTSALEHVFAGLTSAEELHRVVNL